MLFAVLRPLHPLRHDRGSTPAPLRRMSAAVVALIAGFASMLGASSLGQTAAVKQTIRRASLPSPDDGRLLGAFVETNGWVLNLHFRGMSTNGEWDFGYDAERRPAPEPLLRLTLTNPGFTAEGTPTVVTQTIFGARQLRQPFPNQAADDVQPDGAGGCVARVALTEFVFANSRELRLTLRSGLYYENGLESHATDSQAIANRSTLEHPRSLAKWSWPPRWRITNDTYQVRMLAFHRSGMNFCPVRAVKFWAVGSDGATSGPVFVTNLTVTPTLGDAAPIQEFVATLPATPFGDGVWVTNHFTVYPWIGDSNAVISTDHRTESWNTDVAGVSPYYMPYPLLCDRGQRRGGAVAVVSNQGNDAAGRVVSRATFTALTPPPAFRTISAASRAIQSAHQRWPGGHHDDAGGGTILVQAGEYRWTDGPAPAGPLPDTWLTVEAYPGVSASQVVITGGGQGSGSASGAGGMDLLRNLTFHTSGPGILRGQHLVWLDHCLIDHRQGTLFYSPTNVYLTGCTIVTNGSSGLNYLPPTPTTFHLVRGCRFAPLSGQSVQLHTVIGNVREVDDPSSTNTTPTIRQTFRRPPRDGHDAIFAYNRLQYLAAAARGSPVDLYKSGETFERGGGSGVDCDGLVIAGNLLEIHRSSNLTGMPVLAIAWGSMNQPTVNRVNNVLIWNNTLVGNRCNLGEDPAGSGTHGGGVPNDRCLWSVKNNWFSSANTKHDTEYHQDGGRIYGWPILFGVGWAGNWDYRGSYDCGWRFLVAGTPGFQPRDCDNARTNQPAFVRFAAFGGYGTEPNCAGGGDYHLLPTSPGIDYGTSAPSQQVLPFDLDGLPRYSGGAIGAYEFVPDRPGVSP